MHGVDGFNEVALITEGMHMRPISLLLTRTTLQSLSVSLTHILIETKCLTEQVACPQAESLRLRAAGVAAQEGSHHIRQVTRAPPSKQHGGS